MRRFDQSSQGPTHPRRHVTVGLAFGAMALVVGLVIGTNGGIAAAGSEGLSRGATVLSNPMIGHPYRHGAVPLRAPSAPSSAPNKPEQRVNAPRGTTAGPALRDAVSFGGGSVVTQSPKVFLVFWGSGWGSQSTGIGGYANYSGDPNGLAPNLQAFFAGLGTNSESWSAIVTQYCQGVPVGTKTCPLAPLTNHVAYPSSTVLGGVWEDTSTALATATGAQIAQEAANAAVHFSNPPGAQYVIVSPTGTDPDQWLSPRNGYCAYHDNTGDPFLSGVTGPDVPYTNMPYVPDVGAQCSSFFNPGILDGADETVSHEYAEVLTDPFPSSGWTDRRGSEIADKCENLIGGQPGASTYVPLATGTFAVQGIWANDLGKKGGCENAHSPILTVNPGKQKGVDGTPVSFHISAADVRGGTLAYAASGLPAGLAINSASGLISGTPTAHGRSETTVVVADGVASTTVAFIWMTKR